MTKKRGPSKTKKDRRERATLLSKTCAGAPPTLEKTQEQISKKLSKLEVSLSFEKRAAEVAPRRIDGGAALDRPFKRQKEDIPDVVNPKTPSQVDSLTLFNYVEGLKTKSGLGKVNWSAVSTSFNLNSGRAAQSVYQRHIEVVESFKPENHDPAPHIHALDLKRKRELLLHAQEGEGGKVRQLEEDEWEEYIDKLRLEQYKEVNASPNANLDTIGKLCDQTYEKILDWAAPHRKSTNKHLTEGRVDAQNEPRNHIAFAAVVQAEMHDRPIAKELVCSADMFTFWHDPSSGKTRWVRMTHKAAEQLRDQKLGAGYAGAKSSKPVLGKGAIPVYGCIEGAGDIVCIVEIFADPAVPAVDVSVALYHIYPLQTLSSFTNPVYNSFIFAAVVHIDFNEEALLQQIWETIIIPKQTKKAHDMLRARIARTIPTVGLPTPSQSLSVSSRPPNPANPANTSDRSVRGALRTPRAASRPVNQSAGDVVIVLSPSSTQLRPASHAAEMAAQFGEHVPEAFSSPPATQPRHAAGAAASNVMMESPATATRSKLAKRPFSQLSDHIDLEAAFQVSFFIVFHYFVFYICNLCAGCTSRSQSTCRLEEFAVQHRRRYPPIECCHQ